MPCLTSEGFIHWEQARCYLSEMTITDGYDYFLSCVESLSPVFFEVEEHLLSKQQEEIWMKHKIYLEWIPEPHLSNMQRRLILVVHEPGSRRFSELSELT